MGSRQGDPASHRREFVFSVVVVVVVIVCLLCVCSARRDETRTSVPLTAPLLISAANLRGGLECVSPANLILYAAAAMCFHGDGDKSTVSH